MSRWARRALKRGATVTDAGTRAAVAEQLRLGDALRRRIEGGRGSSDDDGDDSATDSDGGCEWLGVDATQHVCCCSYLCAQMMNVHHFDVVVIVCMAVLACSVHVHDASRCQCGEHLPRMQ